jgi:hypothetical protein
VPSQIITQRALRQVRDLPFCHVCGRTFTALDEVDHDHVPPQACFEKIDRNPPLKLRSHKDCNNSNKLNEEKLGQLLTARRRQALDPSETHLNVELYHDQAANLKFAVFDNLDVIGSIRRWVGGFHAALYRSPLPPGTQFFASPPMPQATLSQGVIRPEPIRRQHSLFVTAIKQNRAARNLDVLTACNSKLRYECVWTTDDSGKQWLCIFALDLYDWIGLGDSKNFPARGCVGTYPAPGNKPPPDASIATQLHFEVTDREPFNPFSA